MGHVAAHIAFSIYLNYLLDFQSGHLNPGKKAEVLHLLVHLSRPPLPLPVPQRLLRRLAHRMIPQGLMSTQLSLASDAICLQGHGKQEVRATSSLVSEHYKYLKGLASLGIESVLVT